MTAQITPGARVRSISTRRRGTVAEVHRVGSPDAWALVRWDDGRTVTTGLVCLELAPALVGDPRPWAHGLDSGVQL